MYYKIEQFENQVKKQGFKLTEVKMAKDRDGIHKVIYGKSTIEKANMEILWDNEGRAFVKKINRGEEPRLKYGTDESGGQFVVEIQNRYLRRSMFDLNFGEKNQWIEMGK